LAVQFDRVGRPASRGAEQGGRWSRDRIHTRSMIADATCLPLTAVFPGRSPRPTHRAPAWRVDRASSGRKRVRPVLFRGPCRPDQFDLPARWVRGPTRATAGQRRRRSPSRHPGRG
jgi:hypothetical protein